MRPSILLLSALALTDCGAASSAAGEVTAGPSIPWELADVSDDARAVEVFHEEPHCRTRPGRPQVRETASSVRIRIPLERVDVPADTACRLDLRYTTSRVRLRAPLGRRTLRRPGGRVSSRLAGPGSPCPRVLRASPSAPLFDVPRFARELARCRRPVPPAMLAFGVLAGPADAGDRLTGGQRRELALQPFFLRQDLARAARVGGHVLKLVPGAEQSCLLVRFAGPESGDLACAPSRLVGRRGLFTEDVCEDRTPPRRVRVVGVAPPGLREVRLTRKGRTVARAPVRDGIYAVTGDDPLRLHVGSAVLRLRGATTLC